MSHVVIESNHLKELCEAARQRVQAEREARWVQLAGVVAQQHNESILCRMLGLRRPVTTEQVLIQLKEDADETDMSVVVIVNHGRRVEELAVQLAAAADSATRVVVSIQDVESLHRWALGV